MAYIQLGISGIAENKAFNDALGLPTKTIVRPKLANYILRDVGTNKVSFAKMLNVSPATVTKWLYTDTMPSVEVLHRFAHNMGLSYAEVLAFFEEEPKQ